MRMMMRDAHAMLLRAVREILVEDPLLAAPLAEGLQPLVVEGLASEAWASATFSGQRHRLDLRLTGSPERMEAARRAIAARLCGAEFDLKGHIVADMALVASDTSRHGELESCSMSFEALTVED